MNNCIIFQITKVRMQFIVIKHSNKMTTLESYFPRKINQAMKMKVQKLLKPMKQ